MSFLRCQIYFDLEYEWLCAAYVMWKSIEIAPKKCLSFNILGLIWQTTYIKYFFWRK